MINLIETLSNLIGSPIDSTEPIFPDKNAAPYSYYPLTWRESVSAEFLESIWPIKLSFEILKTYWM